MSRTKWKGPYVKEHILEDLKNSKKTYIKPVVSRNTEILPQFVEQTFKVYNGKTFTEIIVTEEMIGHKFGEFSATRKRFSFKKKNIKK